MWKFLHQVTVLESPWFAFVGIADKVTGFVGLPVKETPFKPGREAGAASSPQSRFNDLLLNLCRGHPEQCFPGRLIASMLPVDLEGPDTRYIDLI